jgi:hypothetical protein
MDSGPGAGSVAPGTASSHFIDFTPHVTAGLLVGGVLVLILLNRGGFRFTYGAGVSGGRAA